MKTIWKVFIFLFALTGFGLLVEIIFFSGAYWYMKLHEPDTRIVKDNYEEYSEQTVIDLNIK